jgi:hypothetical protein
VRLTASYQLWRRLGATLPYQTLTAIDSPGAILDCATSSGRVVAQRQGFAMVQPVPVVGERTFWKGTVGYAGRSAHQILHLAKGPWDISLQYDSTVGVTVRGPGMRAALPPNLEPLGSYWYVGRVHVAHTAWVRIIVSSHPLRLLGRILGAFGLTRAPGDRPLGRLTATRPSSSDRLIPLKKACGRYVDWYRPS